MIKLNNKEKTVLEFLINDTKTRIKPDDVEITLGMSWDEYANSIKKLVRNGYLINNEEADIEILAFTSTVTHQAKLYLRKCESFKNFIVTWVSFACLVVVTIFEIINFLN